MATKRRSATDEDQQVLAFLRGGPRLVIQCNGDALKRCWQRGEVEPCEHPTVKAQDGKPASAVRLTAKGAAAARACGLLLALFLLLPLGGCVEFLDFTNRAWSAPGSYASTMYYTPTPAQQYYTAPCHGGRR